MPYGLYLHIPYCRSRCRYCDFYTKPGSRAVPDGYIDALLRDFEAFAPTTEGGGPARPATVYLGGGTPGLLAPAQVRHLLLAVRPLPGAEVTLEANPEGVTDALLEGFLAAGVNRLSLGVQTARDESLRALGRPHTAAGAERALALARRAGFKNISGDIMLALPGYTAAEFDETLALLRAGGATHLSAYMLKLEPGTRLAAASPAGLPGPDEAADHYLYAVQAMEKAGYAQYEISNFARPGCEGRHNLIYWDAGEWLGLGPAAHSSLGGRRFSFAANLGGYIQKPPVPVDEGEMGAGDYMMLRLRLAEGLDEAALLERFGARLSGRQTRLLEQLCTRGHAKKTPGGWALTPPGMLVQNAVLGQLLEG